MLYVHIMSVDTVVCSIKPLFILQADVSGQKHRPTLYKYINTDVNACLCLSHCTHTVYSKGQYSSFIVY